MSIRSTSSGFLATVIVLTAGLVATAGPIEVLYTEIPGHATAVVPGALDENGQPVYAEFTALENLALRPDGGEWVLKGRCNLGSSLDTLLLLGSGTAGTMFAQDGQPIQGGLPGEMYDFFDSPVPAAWDDFGNMAYSCRARGGDSSVFEKIIVFDGMTQTIVIQMGDPALGLIDRSPNPSGDELFGNSINSVHLFNDGTVGFVNTPIQNCHSFRYPAFFHGNTSFRQSGVSQIGNSIWDSFDYDDCGGTADGLHWFAKGDTEDPDTSIDNILAVDDAIALQEGSPVAGSSMTMAAVFFTRMLSDGSWYCRGDDPNDDDWAVCNGVLLAMTGDPISDTENWGNSFGAFTGNHLGDWLLAGNTDNPDTDRDYVLVFNRSKVLVREGDPIDVDGNGEFDDDAFIRSIQPNDVHLTDDLKVYFLVTLRDGEGTNLGDAFLRMQAPMLGDLNCDGVVNNFDIRPFLLALLATPPDYPEYYDEYPDCDRDLADINGDGNIDNFDIVPFIKLP
ncbi:MAG: hypothetical protein PVJ57_20985 [Phycisphaerae bacterium]|jgi:hypothetical protein